MSDIQEKMTISGTSTCVDDLGIREQIAERKAIAEAIHYPECWDESQYPTLLDAVVNISVYGCTNDDCFFKGEEE